MKVTIIKLSLLSYLVLFFNCAKEQQAPSIYLNQVGYAPSAVKQGFVTGKVNDNSFTLVNSSSQEEVFSGKLSEVKQWPFSGTSVQVADFTNFNENGEYNLVIGNSKKELKINNNINSTLAVESLKTFYLARLSEPILEDYAGIYSRKAGHPDTEVKIHASAASEKRPEGSIISSPGGWYDAGDYNKYIVNSSITVQTLLQSYEMFPNYFDNLNLKIEISI